MVYNQILLTVAMVSFVFMDAVCVVVAIKSIKNICQKILELVEKHSDD